MKNTFRVVWSEESLANLRGIFDYLHARWTIREIKNFSKLLDKKLKLIWDNPLLFPLSEKLTNIRRCVVSKQTTIYYRVEQAEIHIISVFDNRKDPEKLRRF